MLLIPFGIIYAQDLEITCGKNTIEQFISPGIECIPDLSIICSSGTKIFNDVCVDVDFIPIIPTDKITWAIVGDGRCFPYNPNCHPAHYNKIFNDVIPKIDESVGLILKDYEDATSDKVEFVKWDKDNPQNERSCLFNQHEVDGSITKSDLPCPDLMIRFNHLRGWGVANSVSKDCDGNVGFTTAIINNLRYSQQQYPLVVGSFPYNVLKHEIGHLCGLDHSDGGLMSSLSGNGEFTEHHLAKLAELHGVP